MAIARSIRASRPQPLWPRLLGIAFLGVACIYAFEPVPPMAPHVALSAATATEPESAVPAAPAMAIDGLAFDPAARRLSWSSAVVPPPYTVVLLGPDYHEMARSAAPREAAFTLDDRLGAQFVAGETYHALVLGGQEHHTRKSPLLGFTWR